jgi:acyl-CoA reductase-like NAD-dependent aldehyde dehydrogenase
MVEFTKAIKVGASDAEDSLLGPVQNPMQYEKVKDIFADSKAQGYKFATGGPDIAESNGGFFIQPAIIDNPPNGSRIIEEEPFGRCSTLVDIGV